MVAAVYPDYLALVLALLKAGWTSANTDSVTPTIAAIYDVQDGGVFANVARNDVVLVYSSSPESNGPQGCGYYDLEVKAFISVDVRTPYGSTPAAGRAHAVKMRDEVRRIMDAARMGGVSSGCDLVIRGDSQDTTNKRTRVWGFVENFTMMSYAVAVQ